MTHPRIDGRAGAAGLIGSRREPFDVDTRDGAQRAKETLALYRGQACGVQYAEAFRAANASPSELF